MERVIEFPKLETSVEVARPFRSREIFNIASWTPCPEVQLANSLVDAWPFCAA
jgi:hypothetical protein